LTKAARRTAHQPPASAPSRPTVYLKKEELQKVDELRVNIAAGSAQNKPDVQSTFDLMYLRVLGRIKNRGPLEEDLKQLKKMLDQAAAKMNEVIAKSEHQNASK